MKSSEMKSKIIFHCVAKSMRSLKSLDDFPKSLIWRAPVWDSAKMVLDIFQKTQTISHLIQDFFISCSILSNKILHAVRDDHETFKNASAGTQNVSVGTQRSR